MKTLCNKLFVLICCCTAFTMTSCEGEEEFLSLTAEEVSKLMVGSWKLIAASESGPCYIDEEDEVERLKNDLPTSMTSVDITDTGATFHFSSPVPWIDITYENDVYGEKERQVSEITVERNYDYFIDLEARVNYDRGNRLEFISPFWESFSQCRMYGKKETKADRMIIDLHGAYFEFLRK